MTQKNVSKTALIIGSVAVLTVFLARHASSQSTNAAALDLPSQSSPHSVSTTTTPPDSAPTTLTRHTTTTASAPDDATGTNASSSTAPSSGSGGNSNGSATGSSGPASSDTANAGSGGAAQPTGGGESEPNVDYSAVKDIITPKPHHYVRLSTAIAEALDNNLDIQVKKLQSGVTIDQLKQAKGAFEPSFNFDGKYERLNTPQNAQEFVATGGTTFDLDQLDDNPRIFHEENYRWRTSIEGKLPTGMTYEAFNQQDWLRNDLNEDSALSLFSPEYSTFTGVTITQPFLKDFGTDVNMAEIRVERKNKFIADLDLKGTLIATVAQVMTNYLDLAYATENTRLRQEEVDLSLQLTEDRRNQLERGLSSPHDVNRAESAMSEAVEKLVEAEDERVERQNTLLRLIATDVNMGDMSQIIPMNDFEVPQFKFDRTTLIQTALNQRPDFQAALQKVERDQIKIVYAKNQILPRVDFKSTIGINGLASTPGYAFSRSFTPQGPQYSIGLVVNIPFGDETAIGKRDEAIKEKQISITNLKMAENDTILEIDKALAAIDANYKRLQAMRIFQDSAEDSLESEKTRLEKGLSTDMDVQRIHRDVTEARTREIAAVVDYDKAIIALFAADGTLLDHQNIVIEP